MARHSLIPIAPGLRFGRLTVVARAEPNRWGNPKWRCQCDCGKFSQPLAVHLRNKKTQSCGCLQKEIAREQATKDITGQKFAHLTVLHRAGKNCNGKVIWFCRCDCGRFCETLAWPLGTKTKSCGCLRRKKAAQRTIERNYRHGDATRGNQTPLYRCWKNIKTRCLDPKNRAFKNYGGRGISMAPEWINDFLAFKNYVDQNIGPRPKGYTLDRIENYEGYFPGNLHWVHNSRRSRIEKAVTAALLK